jgi:arylsulfatase A-like enzyme
LIALCVLALSSVLCMARAGEKPNIVLILVDDMGWSDIGCYGGEIDTPHIDSLARQGLRFTQFHNTAKCMPSRACLLTGLYAQQCGMDKRPVHFTKNCVTLGDVLRAGGYRTLASGKHHSLDSLYDQGFDRYNGLRDGGCNHFNPGRQRSGEGVPAQKRPAQRVWCFDDKTLIPYTPESRTFYTTDSFTQYALDFLDEYRHETRPFFLYLAYTAPHDPLQAWPEDIRKYEDRYRDGWAVLRRQRYARQKELGLVDESMPLSRASYRDWASLSDQERTTESRKMAVYAAMVDRIDQNVGRLLEQLRALEKLDNTLILFASDNGCSAEVVRLKNQTGKVGAMTRWTSLGGNWANASNTPYRKFKNYSHAGGVCTPFIVWWPGVIQKPGTLTDYPGHFIDIMPTLMQVAGAAYPGFHKGHAVTPYEGVSLVPVLKGQETSRKAPMFWQWSRGKAVMKGRWKAVAWGETWELFDMSRDKTETMDQSARHPEILAQLKMLHAEWLVHCARTKSEE